MDSEDYTFFKQTNDTFPGVTQKVINFKRKKIEELQNELVNEDLEGEIILLDTNIALKPEPLGIQTQEEDDYIEIQGNELDFNGTEFVDVDGNTYKLLGDEVDQMIDDDEYIQFDTNDLEEGEVRDVNTEIFRRNFINTNRFQCPSCERSFSQKGNLLRHYQTHTGSKPFGCKLCGHRFTQKSNLQKHLATHNGDKRFECGVCNKGFVQKANLIRHLRIHTGEKPFECELCGHKFTQKGNLNKHMQLHTSPSESRCDFCDCKFSTYKAKMRHETTVHGDNLNDFQCDEVEPNDNQCTECPATFRTKRALLKHKKYHK
ncbi:gastrula zinc finger protein XlCGF8.2DB-like isoform X2 [Harmonia axyridis]|uniref:gastrula zinc finger protein XlCGF8.2DB-like isoform X1 n=1 Tax=Harmonia axyridis TaxID=115357 RepID=UPI001E276D0E|nr:gastrula zinc finger protein XlCGF8.2DB-like isoform X1 [Harmonia axyridis]XP_045462669.1 gastrula zinc finger protein XlCGF8.2DB-like isoform X2 [Harmonia axyridis]